MRGHKFLCLVGSNYWHEIRDSEELRGQIKWYDDPWMVVLTFPHEKMEDNLCSIVDDDGEEHEYARDIEGCLWYLDNWWTKTQVINNFEQSDERQS